MFIFLKNLIEINEVKQAKKTSLLQKTYIDDCENWIIMEEYTRNFSENAKYLRDTSFGWCILALIGKNSGNSLNYKDIFIFDLNEQNVFSNKLNVDAGFEQNNSNKLFAYLFVISKKAKLIFEYNKDVSINDGLLRFKKEKFEGLQASCDEKNNSFFTKEDFYFNCKLFSATKLDKPPIIQESFLSGDNINIWDLPSISLSQKQYALLSLENTLFHYDSFWSLFFSTRDHKLRSIYSFLIRRITHFIVNGTISFVMNDFTQNEMYMNDKKEHLNQEYAQQLISNLQNSECTNESFEKCLKKHVELLVEKSYIQKEELEQTENWIKMLNSVGYRWPQLDFNSSEEKGKI